MSGPVARLRADLPSFAMFAASIATIHRSPKAFLDAWARSYRRSRCRVIYRGRKCWSMKGHSGAHRTTPPKEEP